MIKGMSILVLLVFIAEIVLLRLGRLHFKHHFLGVPSYDASVTTFVGTSTQVYLELKYYFNVVLPSISDQFA